MQHRSASDKFERRELVISEPNAFAARGRQHLAEVGKVDRSSPARSAESAEMNLRMLALTRQVQALLLANFKGHSPSALRTHGL